MKTLFGDVPDKRPIKGRGHAALPGTGPDNETCGGCAHYRSCEYHDKTYRKCWLVREYWSHGPGTDIRQKDPACKEWERWDGVTSRKLPE